MVKTLLCAAAILMIAAMPIFAENEKLGRDDFLSTTVTDVVDKVTKYTSGEKGFFDRDDRPGRREDEYSTDPLGRTVPDPAIKPLKRPAASE